jgi:hypothetical protein
VGKEGLPVLSGRDQASVKTEQVNLRRSSTNVAVRAKEENMDACDASVKWDNSGALVVYLKQRLAGEMGK